MRKALIRSALLSGLLIVPSVTMAALEDYIGVNLTQIDYSGSTGFNNPELSINTLNFRMLMKVDAIYAGELRLGVGVTDDSATVDDASGAVTVDGEMRFVMGGYVRFSAPVSDTFNPYFITGLTYTDAMFRTRGSDFYRSDEDYGVELSAGLGLDWHLSDKHWLTGEYMVYDATNDGEVVGISLGWLMRY